MSALSPTADTKEPRTILTSYREEIKELEQRIAAYKKAGVAILEEIDNGKQERSDPSVMHPTYQLDPDAVEVFRAALQGGG
jgi:hypothetical protein